MLPYLLYESVTFFSFRTFATQLFQFSHHLRCTTIFPEDKSCLQLFALELLH